MNIKKQLGAALGLVTALLSVSPTPADAADTAGSTAGQFAVQQGAASYTIPLSLPPGLGEMKPELSLSYSSQGGDGPLGMGWGISGLSAISLCPKTIAVDGAYQPVAQVRFAADARFCLDGQRLVLTGGSAGATGAEYRTEIDTFARVRANGWTSIYNGPASFTVETKAGQKFQYGQSPGARSHDGTTFSNQPVAWYVNSISDAVGNLIAFSYIKPPASSSGVSPENLIKQISYSNSTMVVFDYETSVRPDTSRYRNAWYTMERKHRLTQIRTIVAGQTVRTYSFNYALSARTGKSLLKSVTECAASSICLPATTFDWTISSDQLISNSTDDGGDWGGGEWIRVGDFNGDGLSDFSSQINPTTISMKFGKRFGGFTEATWTSPDSWSNQAAWTKAGDFDGDGKTDLIQPESTTLKIRYSRANGMLAKSISNANFGSAENTHVVELNGDGRQDLISFFGSYIYVYLSTGESFSQEVWSNSMLDLASIKNGWAMDKDGDGITDFVKIVNGAPRNFYTNPISKNFVAGGGITWNGTGNWDDRKSVVFGDFNGDGTTDTASINNGALVMAVADGGATPWPIPSLGSLDFTWAFDADGDGRTDIVSLANGSLVANISTGTGFRSPGKFLSAGGSWGSGLWSWLGDFNGDGATDILTHRDNQLHQRLSQIVPEAIQTITSGTGAKIKISYASMTDPRTTVEGGTSVYPTPVVNAPIFLVLEVYASDGSGGPDQMRGTQYTYANLRANMTGRGLQGFEVETVKDLVTGNYEVTNYETDFPKTGMVKRKTAYLASRAIVSETVTSYLVSQPTSKTVFPYVFQSFQMPYADNGAKLSTTMTMQAAPDAYGNFTGMYVQTSNPAATEVHKSSTTNQFTNDAGTWQLGRLIRTTVLRESTGNPSITRVSTFDYNSLGLLSAEIIEPDRVGTPLYLRTDYEYDQYGHKNKITVTGNYYQGSPMPSRVTSNSVSVQYDRIRTDTYNALNHHSWQEMSLAHGGVIRAGDSNGNILITDYDGFGRKIRQTAYADTPYATSTSLSYEKPSSWEASNAVLKITSSDSAGGVSIVFQDLLGRAVRKQTLSLDGEWVYENTVYDQLGHVVRSSRPSFDPMYGPGILTTYDSRGRVATIDAPGTGNTRAYTYYAYNGLSTSVTNSLGIVRTEVRNIIGQTVRVEEGSGSAATNYSYDSVGNLLTTTDTIGQVTSIFYDLRGRKVGMTDPHMGAWGYLYDSFGQLVRRLDAKNQSTWMGYDALGRMTSRSDQGDTAPTTWTYDTAPHGIGLLASLQGLNRYQRLYTYNERALLSALSTTIENNGQLQTYTTSIAYDALNRPKQETRPNGFTVENVYNERGYLVAVRSPTDSSSTVYDAAALQSRVAETLNALQQAQAQVAAYQAQANQANDLATQLTDQANALEAQGLTNLSPADRSAVTTARANATLFRSYAASFQISANQAQAQADSYRRYTEFYISLQSNPYFQSQSWQAYLTVLANDLNARADQYAAQAQAARSTANTYEGIAQQYDATANSYLTAVIAQAATLDAQAAQKLVQAESFRKQAQAKLDEANRYARQLSMLNTNLADSGNIVWWRASRQDAEGRVSEELLGNGLFTTRDYDAGTGQLLTIRTGGVSDGPIQDVAYGYDNQNNVTWRNDDNIDLSATYGYDSLDRLKNASIHHSNTTLPINQTLAWSYDAAGNFESRTVNGVSQQYTYATTTQRKRLTQVNGIGNLVYDANGSLTASGNRSFSWNSDNKPLSLSDGNDSVFYSYGPDRQRTAKFEIRGGNQLYAVGYIDPGYEQVTHLATGSGATSITEHRYPIYAGNQLIATRSLISTDSVNTRRAEYYHKDALGSIDVVTDSIGRIQKRYAYDPFGKRTDVTYLDALATHPTINIKMLLTDGFTGHEHMDELGLIHMNGRVYDALTGRFISADPTIPDAKSTQAFNRYAYVKNNPLKYTDPTGYSWLSKTFKKYWRPIAAIAVAVVAPYAAWAVWGQGLSFTAFALTGAGYATAAATGFAAGLVGSGGDLRAGFVGAATGLAFTGVGSLNLDGFGNTLAHGAVGGVSSTAQGGKFQSGFLSAAVPAGAHARGFGGNAVSAAIIGGTASEIGGGKFANGAVTGAFGYAFNHAAHAASTQPGRALTVGERSLAESVYGDGIDYNNVRIINGKYLPLLQSDNVTMTPNGYIYAPDANYQTDYSAASVGFKEHFIHEMAHVLQYTEGVNVRAAGIGIALSGGYTNQRAYNVTPGMSYRSANIEQQAEMWVDQYRSARQLGVAP